MANFFMFGVLEAVMPGAGSDWASAECIAVEEAEEEETEREIKDASPFARGETRAIDAIAPPRNPQNPGNTTKNSTKKTPKLYHKLRTVQNRKNSLPRLRNCEVLKHRTS
jgi:hypothetical protein